MAQELWCSSLVALKWAITEVDRNLVDWDMQIKQQEKMAMARKKKDENCSSVKLKCFSRVHILNEDGSLAGDSGWTGPNLLTNLGIQKYLAGQLAGTSCPANWMALGTGGLVASAGTTLPGECMASTARHSITSKVYSSRTLQAGSGTQYFYGTFAAGWVTGAGSTIDNVGLYYSNTSNDTLFCGNTYTASACASNQAVNVTYQIQLG